MLSKRDLQFVRLAQKWRWLTAEEGEDVRFLLEKFGGKLAVEEIVRRRGYLEDGEIDELARATDELAGRRPRRPPPSVTRQRPASRAQTSPEVTILGGLTSIQRPPILPDGRPDPRAFEGSPFATILDGAPPALDPALLFPAADETPAPDAPRDDPFEATIDAGADAIIGAGAERTIIAPMPDAVRAAREQYEQRRRPPSPQIQQPMEEEGPTATDLDKKQLRDVARAVRAEAEARAPRVGDAWSRARRPTALRDPAADAASRAETPGRRSPLRSDSPVMPTDLEEEPVDRTIFEPRKYEDDGPVPLPADALELIEPGPSYADRFTTAPADAATPDVEGPAGFVDPAVRAKPPVRDPAEALREVSDASTAIFHEQNQTTGDEATIRPLDLEAVTAEAYQGSLAEDPRAADALLGAFGGYTLERIVARGGRSVVYAGVQTATGYPVAVKVLHADASTSARFVAEHGDDLLAAARIESPHVVRVVDVGRVDTRFYVALDYVDGWTLDEKLAAKERPATLEALTIARDVARALADAEVVGLLHKDVRPGNVLLADTGAMLTGFGFARKTDGLDGSAGYLAPERYAGAPPSAATDLYALGAMLFRLLTQELPFTGEDGRAIAATAATYDATDVRTFDPDIPAEIAELVAALLARDPSQRGGSATAIASHLDRLTFDLEAEGILAAEPTNAPPPLRTVAIRTGLVALAALVLSVVVPAAARSFGLLTKGVALDAALLGALFSIGATVLLATIALIRRGQVPLMLSSAWLVRAQETLGAVGTALLVAGFVMSSPAILNVFVAFLAAIVLGSWMFGIVLRRAVAAAREDGGVGRMLAVLGDPTISRWRAVHAPLLMTLTCLATVRYLLIAYFAAG